MEDFHFIPRWDGPLPGRSFEKQTEDAINGLIRAINASGTAVPSDAYPKAPGHAAPGTSTDYSRGDHVHPAQTTISGNAATASKLETPRAISLSGDASGSAEFDGSADISIPVDIPSATDGSDGLMSAADKAKLDGIESGATAYVLPQATATVLGGVYVDTVLSENSENPVQNRVIQGVVQDVYSSTDAALELKLSVSDTMLLSYIDSLFTSGGGTAPDYAGITVDDALSPTSTNPVQNKVIDAALDDLVTTAMIDGMF